ncbi:MAG: phosphatidylserine decarboxylase [Deltaproteobacteria bacterium]|nr:phosphatidylserine decarboxylase [Deltaproteobacteria bacterium]
MGKSASRLAAQTVRVLPRKRLSRALGSLAASRAPQPVVDAAVAAFVRAYDVDLSEVAMPPGGFRTFDDFFTRRLLDGTRVVDSDPKALVSPADGRLEDCGAITAGGELTVKGQPYTATALLGDPEAAAAYEGGHYFIVYLSPRDYHRVHAPTCGSVQCMRYIPGTLFPVNRIGTDFIPQLFARNERLAIVQEGVVHGVVTTIMVGAIGVGRIGLSFDDVQTNRGDTPGLRSYADSPIPRDRGDELGVFHMGSTAIVMTPPECKLDVVAQAGASIRMGEAMATGGVDER